MQGYKFTGTYFGKVGKDISSCDRNLTCALQLADLNFSAQLESVYDQRGNVIDRTVNVARADNGNSLGVMGAKYAITQPRDAFKYLDALPGGARFQRGGMMKEGRFFLSAEFDTFSAGEGDSDQMTAFGVFLSSFDGSWSNRIVWILGRHSCTNICRFEIGSASVGAMNGRGGRVAKHTANHGIKLDNFIIALHLAQDNLKSEVSKLNGRVITEATLRTCIERVMPGDSKKGENMRNSVADYFHRADLGINGRTAWDAFNAFSAFDTHSATRRETSVATADENAFDALIAGRGFADKALPILMELTASN